MMFNIIKEYRYTYYIETLLTFEYIISLGFLIIMTVKTGCCDQLFHKTTGISVT